MSSVGIHAVGAYAPRYKITAEAFEAAWDGFEAAGIETTTVPDADEDTLTMGWEAATRALEAAGCDGTDIEFLAFATTTPPLEEEDPTARLGSMLGVSASATRRLATGSTRAGTQALVTALESRPSRGLVVAADCPRGKPHDAREHAAGAGAAALLVGPDAPVVVKGHAEHAEPYPGTRFREPGKTRIDGIDAGGYDRAAFIDPLANAVDKLEFGDIDAAALQMPDGKLPYRAASECGLNSETVQAGATVSALGDTGAASVPLGIARALSNEADRILAASWGSGAGSDALLFNSEADVPVTLLIDNNEKVTYSTYLRLRGEITATELDGGGAYVSVPTWHRSLPQRHRLVAGQCPECRAYSFPPTGACVNCETLVDFETIELPGTGTVATDTEIRQGGAPPEFAELQSRSGPFSVVIVDFDAPAEEEAVAAPAMAVDNASTGDRVRAVQRRIYTQEGVPRYGFKVRQV